jgi:uncharacterized protein YjiS (DUF1127 family)
VGNREVGCRAVEQCLRGRPAASPVSTFAVVRSILTLIRLWLERSRVRRQLAALSDRELQDIGTCWSEVAVEAGKPFWRKRWRK